MLSLTAYYIWEKLLNSAGLSNGLTRWKKNFCVSEILMFLCKGSSYNENFKPVKMALNHSSASGSFSQTGLFRLQCKLSKYNNCGTADHGSFQRPVRGYIKLFFSLCQVESNSSLWLILFFFQRDFIFLSSRRVTA